MCGPLIECRIPVVELSQRNVQRFCSLRKIQLATCFDQSLPDPGVDNWQSQTIAMRVVEGLGPRQQSRQIASRFSGYP